MSWYYLDKGTYETECSENAGSFSTERLIIRCDSGGNINEVISYTTTYEQSGCSTILQETSLVSSLSLSSGTQGTKNIING